MRIEQLFGMRKKWTDYLRLRFKQQKIYLVAQSWGTEIGLSLAARSPEKFHAYIALGQITSWVENDRLGYHWVRKRAEETHNRKAIRELAAIGEPPFVESFKQWAVLRTWLMRYNSMVYNTGGKDLPTFFRSLKIMLKSPDYTIRDVFHSMISGFKLTYTQTFIEDIAVVNFCEETRRLELPAFFIHGRHETHVFLLISVVVFRNAICSIWKGSVLARRVLHMYHPRDAKQVEKILIQDVLGRKKP